MSTRWYPRYVRGNPQLRVFLPDFWMILKKPDTPLPANKVIFKVPLQMTKYDVRNYLEKIYKIPVVNIETRAVMGKIKRATGKAYMIKEDDYREAIVDLPKEVNFEYPKLFPDSTEKLEEEIEDVTKRMDFVKLRERRRLYNENRHNVPSWFGL